MKQPEKLGPVDEFSPEYRLCEVERKFDVLLQKIQAYDKVLDAFSNLNKRLDLIEATHSSISSVVKKSEQNSNDVSSFILSHKEEINKEINNLKSLAERLKADKEDVLKTHAESVSSLSKKINEVDSQHFENFQSLPTYSALETAIQSLRNTVNKSNATVENVKIQNEHLTSQTHLLEEKFNKVSSAVDVNQGRLTALNNALDMNAHHTKLAAKVLTDKYNQYLEDFRTEVRAHLDETRVQIQGTPSSLADTKQALLSKMESVSLDSANANQRSLNHEQQMRLFDKKLESLALQLKKIEIS